MQNSGRSSSGAGIALGLLLTINLFNYIDRYILAAVEPQIRHTFFSAGDLNAMAKTGALNTAFLVTYMISAPIFGILADRFSRWWLVGIGIAVWSLASGATGFAVSFALIFLARIFVGVGEGAYGPAAPTILADLYPLQIRGRIMSVFFMAIPVGSALGYAFGGWAGAHFGWRSAFYLVVVPGLILSALCFTMREPRQQTGAASIAKRRDLLADVVSLFKTKSYVVNCVAGAAMTFAIGGLAFWTPAYIYEFRHQPDLGRINLIFGAIVVVAGFFATLLGGWAGDKLRARFPGSYFLVSGAGMLIGFPFVIAMLFVPFPWAWLAIFIAVFFLFLNTGPSNTALANATHPAVRATAFAVNIFLIHLFGDAMSPPLIGAIAGHANMNVAFMVVSLTMGLAGALWLWGAKYLPEDTARVEAATARV